MRSKKTIIRAYKSLALNVSVDHSAAQEPIYKWGGFEMGRFLNVSPKNKITNQDTAEKAFAKRNAVRNIFGQTIESAKSLIANVEIGRFPCKDTVNPCPRWTKSQQIELDHAVDSGYWQSSNWLVNEHKFLMPNEPIFVDNPQECSAQQILRRIDSFKVSFLTPKRATKKKSLSQ